MNLIFMVEVWRALGLKSTKKPLPSFLLLAEPFSLSFHYGLQPLTSFTTGLNTSISIIRSRPTTSYSERVAEPLSLLYNFSSSFTSNRHWPPSLYWSLLSHQQNLFVTTKLPPHQVISSSFPSSSSFRSTSIVLQSEQWRVN